MRALLLAGNNPGNMNEPERGEEIRELEREGYNNE